MTATARRLEPSMFRILGRAHGQPLSVALNIFCPTTAAAGEPDRAKQELTARLCRGDLVATGIAQGRHRVLIVAETFIAAKLDVEGGVVESITGNRWRSVRVSERTGEFCMVEIMAENRRRILAGEALDHVTPEAQALVRWAADNPDLAGKRIPTAESVRVTLHERRRRGDQVIRNEL